MLPQAKLRCACDEPDHKAGRGVWFLSGFTQEQLKTDCFRILERENLWMAQLAGHSFLTCARFRAACPGEYRERLPIIL